MGQVRRRAAAWAAGAALVATGCVAVPTGAGSSPGQSVSSLAGGSLTATQLAQTLVGSGVTISNVTYTGDNHAAGRFSGMNAIGIDQGVVLSSGAVATEDGYTSSVVGPNSTDSVSASLNQPGDSDLDALVAPVATLDAASLEFDFVPTTSQISLNYVFGSDEYNEYVGSYNDVFGFFVNGRNCAVIGDTQTPVSISNVNLNKNANLYRDNDPSDAGQPSIDTQLDGITTVLTCAADVTAGQVNHLKLAIADAGDDAYDSDVFIAGGSVQANNPPTAADDDGYAARSGRPLTVAAPGVLANDTDPESDALSVDPDSVTQPAHGQVSVSADGGFVYTADGDYVGQDQFTYRASDGAADSEPATVSIDVTAPESQAITITSTPDHPVVGGTYTIKATGGGSGNPVTFGVDPSSADGACTVSDNGDSTAQVSFTGAARCVVAADQDGDSTYRPAPTQTQTIRIGKAGQRITFTSTAPKSAQARDTYTVTATGGGTGKPVKFSATAADDGICTVDDNRSNGGDEWAATVTFTGRGRCVINARQQGSADYKQAALKRQVVTVK